MPDVRCQGIKRFLLEFGFDFWNFSFGSDLMNQSLTLNGAIAHPLHQRAVVDPKKIISL